MRGQANTRNLRPARVRRTLPPRLARYKLRGLLGSGSSNYQIAEGLVSWSICSTFGVVVLLFGFAGQQLERSLAAALAGSLESACPHALLAYLRSKASAQGPAMFAALRRQHLCRPRPRQPHPRPHMYQPWLPNVNAHQASARQVAG